MFHCDLLPSPSGEGLGVRPLSEWIVCFTTVKKYVFLNHCSTTVQPLLNYRNEQMLVELKINLLAELFY